MTKKQVRETTQALKRVQAHLAALVKDRDRLRTTVQDLEDTLESLDEGAGLFSDGLRQIQDGLDKFSERI